MRKTIISSLLLLGSTSLLADTTMCFKENASMTTIESVALNGGACEGKYSINDMKAKGWSVDDIKISQTASGTNFIYILKSADHAKVAPMVSGGIVAGSAINQEQLEANIMAKLEAKKVAEEKAQVALELKEAKIDAKEIYVNKCQSCHGEKGELSRSTFKAIRTLSTDDMEETLKDYKLGRGEKASSIYAAAHVNYLDTKTIKGIKAYLDSVNNK